MFPELALVQRGERLRGAGDAPGMMPELAEKLADEFRDRIVILADQDGEAAGR